MRKTSRYLIQKLTWVWGAINQTPQKPARIDWDGISIQYRPWDLTEMEDIFLVGIEEIVKGRTCEGMRDHWER